MKNSIIGTPSIASLFSAYASLSAFITLLQQAYIQFIPQYVRDYIDRKLDEWFNKSKRSFSSFTLIIEQSDEMERFHSTPNQVFEACEKYLCTKLSSIADSLKVTRPRAEDPPNFRLAHGQQYTEVFDGVEISWSYIISSGDKDSNQREEKRYFEVTIPKVHRDKVLKCYLPFVLNSYDQIRETHKELKLHTLDKFYASWHSVDFKHPFTFDSMAMDPEMKKSIIDDLDRFVKRKEFYKRVGKAWKRGYLLYGPPGTGKSSLIAAIANYLKFDIYDLQLAEVENDSTLRSLMLRTENKSILVIEDIDCTIGLPKSREEDEDDDDSSSFDEYCATAKISLSGLLNFLDGLWSSCGDERIVILTTNHKEKLDPALLRPGRMDMHIQMSYLTMAGFRVLASNYLDVPSDEHHPLIEEIESLIQTVNVTAAQVAEEMMRSIDADTAFQGLVELLKKKRPEGKKKTYDGVVLSEKKMIEEVGDKEKVDDL